MSSFSAPLLSRKQTAHEDRDSEMARKKSRVVIYFKSTELMCFHKCTHHPASIYILQSRQTFRYHIKSCRTGFTLQIIDDSERIDLMCGGTVKVNYLDRDPRIKSQTYQLKYKNKKFIFCYPTIVGLDFDHQTPKLKIFEHHTTMQIEYKWPSGPFRSLRCHKSA